MMASVTTTIIFLMWITFGISTLVYAVYATGYNRIFMFKEPVDGKILPGHVIKTEKVANEGSCRVKCFMEPNCVSINVGPDEHGGRMCELKNFTDESSSQSGLEEKEGYIHYAVENFCHSDPCPVRNFLCQVGFTDKGHRCVCRNGFKGDNCEDINECTDGSHNCGDASNCENIPGSFFCICKLGFTNDGTQCEASTSPATRTTTFSTPPSASNLPTSLTDTITSKAPVTPTTTSGNQLVAKSCTYLKNGKPTAKSGYYDIDPDGEGDQAPFSVYCDMTDKNGIGVTVISHDTEDRFHVKGFERPGSYSHAIHYEGASLSQLANLNRISSHCEQFINYSCYHSVIFRNSGYAWWVSRDSTKMTYWGGASPGSGKCACGMNNTCADSERACNCDKNDYVWREDSGLLTDKTELPVKQLRFGDTGGT